MCSRPLVVLPNTLIVASQTRLDTSQHDLGRPSYRVILERIQLVHQTPCRDTCRAVIHPVLIVLMAGDDDGLTFWCRLAEPGAFLQSIWKLGAFLQLFFGRGHFCNLTFEVGISAINYRKGAFLQLFTQKGAFLRFHSPYYTQNGSPPFRVAGYWPFLIFHFYKLFDIFKSIFWKP